MPDTEAEAEAFRAARPADVPESLDVLESGIRQPPAGQPVAVRWRRRPAVRALGMRPTTARLWALVMVVGFLTAGAIEPIPDGPDPVVPAWINAVGNVTLLILLAAVVTLLAGRRAGYGLATYASAGLVLLSALCPTSGHHVLAPWWFGQFAITVGLFAGSLALRSRAAHSQAAHSRAAHSRAARSQALRRRPGE
ncbi:hypothetical protein [Frankia sp. Cr1]|uniref:hypothetical protein n=1 Tax=Frankia sp. Cr1 TaxID=3073931 RepID=UPI002AD426E3|nr:hypothetical protein [Frankia sp. Cr1]